MKKVILCVAILATVVISAHSQQNEPCVSVGQAITLNLIPCFGLGSFMQGDISGGGEQLLLGMFGWMILIYSLQGLGQIGGEFAGLPIIGVEAGLCMLVPGYIMAIRRPSRYVKGNYSGASFGITPCVKPCADLEEPLLGIQIQLRSPLQ